MVGRRFASEFNDSLTANGQWRVGRGFRLLPRKVKRAAQGGPLAIFTAAFYEAIGRDRGTRVRRVRLIPRERTRS